MIYSIIIEVDNIFEKIVKEKEEEGKINIKMENIRK